MSIMELLSVCAQWMMGTLCCGYRERSGVEWSGVADEMGESDGGNVKKKL